MKLTRENKTLYEYEFNTVEELIEQLGKIRAMHNGDIDISFAGDDNYGYKIKFSWVRPMTEEEEERDRVNQKLAQEAAKEARRQQFEKLRAEFETDGIRD